MDKILNKEFFATIISSNVLAPYLQQDSNLRKLLKTPNHPDIHYPTSYAPAKQIKTGFKRRMNYMISKGIELNLDATKHLVDFMEEHSTGRIYNVTFNCAKQHYGVRCGLIENHLQVICVMTGGRIPDEAFGEAIK